MFQIRQHDSLRLVNPRTYPSYMNKIQKERYGEEQHHQEIMKKVKIFFLLTLNTICLNVRGTKVHNFFIDDSVLYCSLSAVNCDEDVHTHQSRSNKISPASPPGLPLPLPPLPDDGDLTHPHHQQSPTHRGTRHLESQHKKLGQIDKFLKQGTVKQNTVIINRLGRLRGGKGVF